VRERELYTRCRRALQIKKNVIGNLFALERSSI